ncbi:MAG: bifunctional diaminohydroxyphosphoribosylaminopyrimidine deaminase/5-amino-6-(5-phosphoribosylamino)uracil reductase RibD [Gemmatimonadales bacterium]
MPALPLGRWAKSRAGAATSSSTEEVRDGAAMDNARMRYVIETLAPRGWGQTSPNPLVGALVTNGGEILGEGHHAQFGGPHAEIVALRNAGDAARGATMYVNLEPCNHQGKTPPCTDAIIAAGIARVVVAIPDPNPEASGGAEKLRDAGIEVEFGVCTADAWELNAPFMSSFASDRPWVTLKLAVSLDGSIAPADRKPTIVTGDLSRTRVQKMRAGNDAIAVGAATAAADDPQLTARYDPPPRVPPTRIVFDRSARLSSQSRLAQTAREAPVLIVTGETTQLPAVLAGLGVRSLAAHDLDDALRKLKFTGINSLMVEGGAGLAASFLGSGFVDRLVIFQAPIILGNGSLNAFSGIAAQPIEEAPRFRVIRSEPIGDDIMTTYAIETLSVYRIN